jgi:hypothetical protein
MGGQGSGRKSKGRKLAEALTAAIADDDDEEIQEIISAEEAEVYDRYSKIRAKLGGGTAQGRVKIQRRTKEGTIVSLPSMPFEGFDEDAVAARYGGGRYFLRFYKGDDFLGSDSFEIDDSVRPIDAAPVGMARTASGMPLDPLAAMMAGQMEGLKLLVASQGKMTEALMMALVSGGNRRNEKDPIDVGLQIAGLLKEATGGVERLGIKDMAETFREGLSLGRGLSGGDEGLVGVARELAPAVGDALQSIADIERHKRGIPVAPRTGKALPSGTAPTPAPRADPAPAGGNAGIDLSKAPWLAHLQPFLREIATWAQQGWDPEAYVTSMVARMPDNVVAEIDAAAQDPAFVETALAALPAPFLAFRAWVTKALASLKEQVKEPEEGHEEDDDDPSA